ncbi:hypothetical protein GCM10023085_73050 [Actinomadura viridis]|uniref:DUF3237 domain-containing protein n=1 Tax=Actinomadura viridis TaxID=58110 RepID=A0A931DS35_9ACTN|nr:DUF3237 family protein [Actinomadura viridis]MBG6092937.1 hypothetical protein [Actinomadura viridis]
MPSPPRNRPRAPRPTSIWSTCARWTSLSERSRPCPADRRQGIVQTHDGAAIQLTTTGRADLGEHTGRFLAGEEVGADDAYIRTCPLFETRARYAWLNRLVTVARCDLSISRIRYRISALA